MISNDVAAAASPRQLPSTSKGRVPGRAVRFAENQLLTLRTANHSLIQ